MFMSLIVASLSFIALVILIIAHGRNKSSKKRNPAKQAIPSAPPALTQIPQTVPTKPITTHYSDTPKIREYPTTAAIYKSGQFTAGERNAEYRRRGKSPSGVIDGVYNDTYCENGVSYNDMNRDWDADA